MKRTIFLFALAATMVGCNTLPKGLTKDCKPHCDIVTVTSGITGKQYSACYCDSSNQYRKLIGKLESLQD